MAIFSTGFWLGFAIGFLGGGALVWFYKAKIQADVTTVNAAVVQAKSIASTVVTDIKKV